MGGYHPRERELRRKRYYRAPERVRTEREAAPSCERKTRYASEAVARATALRLFEKARADVETLWVYGCGHCRGWHLTKNGHLNQGAAPVRPGAIYAEPAQ